MDINYNNLPNYMVAGVRRYINNGIAPGSFLTAVITNNLFDAVGRADTTNQKALVNWIRFFYNEAPGGCWGSLEKMNAWINHNGLFNDNGNR
jgi:hypothetical protein